MVCQYQYVVHGIHVQFLMHRRVAAFTMYISHHLKFIVYVVDATQRLLWLIALCAGVESNFEKVSSAFATTQSVPYDYRSIMHYSAYAFSQNGNPTIEPINSSVSLRDLGQRSGFSDHDLQHVNVLYCGESE